MRVENVDMREGGSSEFVQVVGQLGHLELEVLSLAICHALIIDLVPLLHGVTRHVLSGRRCTEGTPVHPSVGEGLRQSQRTRPLEGRP